MAFKPLSEWIISGLQPTGLYQDKKISFGIVNYFIGKNTTGKTQILTQINEQVKALANATRTTEDLVAKFVPANRTYNITGQIAMRGDKLEQFETDTPSAESFYQFLNESEFTKSIVESKLNNFFNKSMKITPQGSNITMEILEKWQSQQEKSKRLRKRDKSSAEDVQGSQLPTRFNLSTESDGIKEFLILLTYIYHPRVKYLVIDEPELHLHPHMINFLLSAIEEAALEKDKQFFIVTHSPIVIRLVPNTDWKYFFLIKNKNRINNFDRFSDSSYIHLIPQLNSFKREAFYSDLIVLVEGDADYQIFQNIANKLGYSGTEKGGFSFFPSWGADEFENLFNFFTEIGKKTVIIADNNISQNKSNFTGDFLKKIIKDKKITKILSKKDITEFCKKRSLYKNKKSLSWKEKREVIREEIREINTNGFDRNTYKELIDLLSKILGKPNKFTLPDELIELTRRMVGEFQLQFNKSELQEVIKKNDKETLKLKITENPKLNVYWRDIDQESFFIKHSPSNNYWDCSMSFRLGTNLIHVKFSSASRHVEFRPIIKRIKDEN